MNIFISFEIKVKQPLPAKQTFIINVDLLHYHKRPFVAKVFDLFRSFKIVIVCVYNCQSHYA